MKRYTAGFLFSVDNTNVLLIQKNKPDWQKGKWNGIGGKIEGGETARQCMVREFEEEAGLRIEEWNHFATLHDAANEHFAVFFFFAHGDTTQAVSTTDEVICEWPVNNLPDTIPNLRWLIPMALSMKHDSTEVFDIAESYAQQTSYESRTESKAQMMTFNEAVEQAKQNGEWTPEMEEKWGPALNGDAEMTYLIYVNHKRHAVTQKQLTYDEVAKLAYPNITLPAVLSVAYHAYTDDIPNGCLAPNQTIDVTGGMVFSVFDTSNA